jgi:arginyl-tRNA synthetase
VLFNDVYNECKNSFLAETKTRHEDWSAEKIDEVAEKLTMATLKFEMIKVSAEKIITFNVKEALRFEGYTAAYLQYSCARINSVLAKAGDWMISTEALDFAESARSTQWRICVSIVGSGRVRDTSRFSAKSATCLYASKCSPENRKH